MASKYLNLNGKSRNRTKQSGNLAYTVVKRVTYSFTWAGRLPYARSQVQTLSEVNRIPSIILSAKMRYCSRLGVNYSSRFIEKERKSEEDRNCRRAKLGVVRRGFWQVSGGNKNAAL